MAMKIYLGCDLFVQGQRWQANMVQKELLKRAEEIGLEVDIYNPAENLSINDKDAKFASGALILREDYNRLKESDVLIALMDTQDIGLAAEMGIAFERNIPIVQLYTDIRLGGNDKQDKIEELQRDIFQNDFLYVNKLVTALSYTFKNSEDQVLELENPSIFRDVDSLVDYVIKRLVFLNNRVYF
ncbi:nucleoside 2-deoxyribosyltransferase [Aerococcaceae bacterium zg-B36]|uniref:nucleoside 2-deoxyribosyltransferase n=1 Tax=Aerococcaceae bacterium zg-252 TaxID=2796928 RepID=UPI001BD868AC|nr:nucleoside 2-deoxyribosyltransferase [Aerococcaceae bacterium zg-B36]